MFGLPYVTCSCNTNDMLHATKFASLHVLHNNLLVEEDTKQKPPKMPKTSIWDTKDNKTPTMHGFAADNNNKVYMELMIFLWNNHYNLNFNVGLSDNSKK